MNVAASHMHGTFPAKSTLPKIGARNAAPYLTTAALYILLFSALPQFDIACQVISICLLGLAAASTFINGGRIGMARLSVFEGCLLSMAGLSLLAFFLSSDAYSATYTCMFAFTVLSISIISRAMSSRAILRSAGNAFALMVISTAVLEYQNWFEALTISADMRWAFRFTPFGLHPNLTGIIFCGAAALFLGYGASLAAYRKWGFFALAAACVSITLAASARGPLLALVLSLGFCSLLFLPKLGTRAIAASIVALSLGLLCAFLFADRIIDYLWVALELGSEQRGLDSGGTGRFDLWQQGFALILSRTWQTFIGSGLRTTDPDHIGFWTENSYITIILESGVFASIAVVASLLNNIWKAAHLVRTANAGQAAVYFGILTFLVFFVVESLSNRYLIAIGNPISLAFLLINIRLSLLSPPRPSIQRS